MLKPLLLWGSLLTGGLLWGQGYQYRLNLHDVPADWIRVELTVPPQTEETVVFHFPKTIPGTYERQDYGRLISQFEALDANGKRLPVRSVGRNAHKISQARALHTLRYRVDDSFDAQMGANKIFEPAGTSIVANTCFLINAAGFLGFFEGQENLPFELICEKPAALYGSTALETTFLGPDQQHFRAERYQALQDAPILFARPDTTSFQVANTRIEIAAYAASGQPVAPSISHQVESTMQAIARFLGDSLPVDRYTFLFYYDDFRREGEAIQSMRKLSVFNISKVKRLFGKAFGALEHNTSSVYYLPELGGGLEVFSLPEICSHEFLHVLTPLNLHSEYIGEFDYIKPQMSRHLWLYEGITEYFSGIALVQGGIMDPITYLHRILRPKIRYARHWPTAEMSFTEMSSQVWEKPWKEQYFQVYQRGALIGALLDIEIMRLTEGQKTLLDVVQALSRRYGQARSFDEASFIAEFVAEVHPDLASFFAAYIEGRERLPLAESLAKAGVAYIPRSEARRALSPLMRSKYGLKVSTPWLVEGRVINRVAKKATVPAQKGDWTAAWAGQVAIRDSMGHFLAEGQTAHLRVRREEAELLLPFTIQVGGQYYEDDLQLILAPSPAQSLIRRRWLGR